VISRDSRLRQAHALQLAVAMFFPGGTTTRRKNCLAGLVFVSFIGCFPVAVLSATGGKPVDSEAWQAHFEDWIETKLVKEQLDQAADRLPELEATATIRVLHQLIKARLDSHPEELLLPSEVVAGLQARGLSGPSLQAARHYARGDVERALEILEAAELEADPDSAHLRALFYDQANLSAKPFYRLENIADYRYALSLSKNAGQVERARVRVGQIFLELRLFPEARATLRPLLEAKLRKPYDTAALVSFAETAYLDGDWKRTIASILKFKLDTLSPELRHWAIRRTADSLYQLENFHAAIRAYSRLIEEASEPSRIAPIARLRLSVSLLEAGKPAEAQIELRPVLSGEAPRQLIALAGLLLARGLRETEAFVAAAEVAAEVARELPGSEEAALAAVEIMESELLAGRQKPQPHPAALELAKKAVRAPAFGLLAYRVAAGPREGSSPRKARQELGKLLRKLPEGPVRKLTQDDLTMRLQAQLRQVHLGKERLDPQVLEEVERYLRPSQIDENALLLALDAFASAGRWESCMRWGRVLHRSEVRPIRKGLGAWREMRCRGAKEPKLVSATSLILLADSGKSGPFALALAALAAELMLRTGQVSKAMRAYDRGLQAVAEPRLLGPALLRAGELNVYHGEASLGIRRLLRGLSVTDDDEVAGDPFRKAGLVALSRAVAEQRSAQSQDFADLVRHEGERAEDWWKPAYGYLGFRSAGTPAPRGSDLFSRAALEFRRTDQLESRVKDLVGEEALEAARAKEMTP
jgi:hypothetical protein